MKDVTTATGTTVPGDAIQQLLFTTDWLTGVRAVAHDSISERASYAYANAYALSGGGEFHEDAHSVAVTNLLHCTANSIVAFALHHLRPLLPDLTDEQWARIDATVTALDLRVSEDLTGANGTDPRDVRVPSPEQLTLAPEAVGQTALWGSSGREPDAGPGA
ncbi:hypothetical protein ACFY2H_30295 [Streptomyces griseofuscus]|uniref:hypothetical protein n=1 Tax=Streptomycetaceae TaxID=2062 RepID=UPI00056323CA|nr:hypothetical protein [Actinacidiphila yeochonensis]